MSRKGRGEDTIEVRWEGVKLPKCLIDAPASRSRWQVVVEMAGSRFQIISFAPTSPNHQHFHETKPGLQPISFHHCHQVPEFLTKGLRA